MKKTVLFLTSVLILVNTSYGQVINHKVYLIKKQLEVVRKADSLLLDYLPRSFEDYAAIYGDIECPLYHEINILSHLLYSECINYDLFIAKVIDISIVTKPDSTIIVDHVQELQIVVQTLLANNLQQVINCLNSKTKNENIYFWAFVFGGIEERADKEEKDNQKRRIRRLHDWNNPGYKFLSSIESGFEKSKSYLIAHRD